MAFFTENLPNEIENEGNSKRNKQFQTQSYFITMIKIWNEFYVHLKQLTNGQTLIKTLAAKHFEVIRSLNRCCWTWLHRERGGGKVKSIDLLILTLFTASIFQEIVAFCVKNMKNKGKKWKKSRKIRKKKGKKFF